MTKGPKATCLVVHYNLTMHSTHELIKARFAMVRLNLVEILEKLADDVLDWAPMQGMRTISGQLAEIAGTEIQVISVLRDGVRLTSVATEYQVGSRTSLTSLVAMLYRTRGETLDYLDKLTEEELREEVALPEGWSESLGLPSVPRAEVFRSLAQHESYHVGQLVSYLWAGGDNPYADELS